MTGGPDATAVLPRPGRVQDKIVTFLIFLSFFA
jgi:hypothetical protein